MHFWRLHVAILTFALTNHGRRSYSSELREYAKKSVRKKETQSPNVNLPTADAFFRSLLAHQIDREIGPHEELNEIAMQLRLSSFVTCARKLMNDGETTVDLPASRTGGWLSSELYRVCRSITRAAAKVNPNRPEEVLKRLVIIQLKPKLEPMVFRSQGVLHEAEHDGGGSSGEEKW